MDDFRHTSPFIGAAAAEVIFQINYCLVVAVGVAWPWQLTGRNPYTRSRYSLRRIVGIGNNTDANVAAEKPVVAEDAGGICLFSMFNHAALRRNLSYAMNRPMRQHHTLHANGGSNRFRLRQGKPRGDHPVSPVRIDGQNFCARSRQRCSHHVDRSLSVKMQVDQDTILRIHLDGAAGCGFGLR